MRLGWIVGVWLGFNAAVVALLVLGSLASAIRRRIGRSSEQPNMYGGGLIHQQAGKGGVR